MSVFIDGHCFLDTYETMVLAFEELCGETGKPFRGAVSCFPQGDGSGPAMWRIEINHWDDNGNGNVTAELGDHLILTYGHLLKLTDSEYQVATS